MEKKLGFQNYKGRVLIWYNVPKTQSILSFYVDSHYLTI